MKLVTGGAGFIGANFVLQEISKGDDIVVLDALTYAGNLDNLSTVKDSPNFFFEQGSVGDPDFIEQVIDKYRPTVIVNFAAESHVDRSISDPRSFINTNLLGTFNLLEKALYFWQNLNKKMQLEFRFLQVSSDEVYGTLRPDDPPFEETNQFAPNSPYSASKAGADHLVRAFFHTYNLPVLTTNCSNNFGPFQFPEKLIPLMIHNALKEKPLPIYGDGMQVRDWLFVADHCRAIAEVIDKGDPGETYNIGGNNELANIELVRKICSIIDEIAPRASGSYRDLISHITDRPGHDRRYAINNNKISREIGWSPKENFEESIKKTVKWYIENALWVERINSGAYRNSSPTNESCPSEL